MVTELCYTGSHTSENGVVTVECVFNLKSKRLFASKPTQIPPLGIRVAEDLRTIGFSHKKKQYSELCAVCASVALFNFSLYDFEKNSTSPEVLQSRFAEMRANFGKHVEFYTDGSKTGESAACAVIWGNQVKSMRLPDKSSVYTAELVAIRMSLEVIQCSSDWHFVIYSDSLSSLQAIHSFDINNVTVFNILKLYTQLTDADRHITLCRTPSHVGIKGNEMADMAAKAGIRSAITRNKMPADSFLPITIYLKALYGRMARDLEQHSCKQTSVWNHCWEKTDHVHCLTVMTKQSSLDSELVILEWLTHISCQERVSLSVISASVL